MCACVLHWPTAHGRGPELVSTAAPTFMLNLVRLAHVYLVLWSWYFGTLAGKSFAAVCPLSAATST